MQECDIILLKIIDKICRKNSLDYWLAFGTFLGCYRHGDFIPWDDDTDICMPRADYNKALSIFKEVLAPYGFYIHENRWLGIGYKHSQTGIWVDVFPEDDYFSDTEFEETQKHVAKGMGKYEKAFISQRDPSIKWKEDARKRYIGGTSDNDGSNHYLYASPEHNPFKIVHHYEYFEFY